jgi:hypothetical protein
MYTMYDVYVRVAVLNNDGAWMVLRLQLDYLDRTRTSHVHRNLTH